MLKLALLNWKGTGMGRRLLIVENQVIIAMDIAERARRRGWTPCGPHAGVADALAALQRERPDAAVLDLSLHADQDCTPLCEALQAAGAPFVFTNSHAKRFDALFPDAPRLEKPFSDDDFAAALARLEAEAGTPERAPGPDREPPAPA
jgi:DNA-binding response OmpR family regulator